LSYKTCNVHYYNKGTPGFPVVTPNSVNLDEMQKCVVTDFYIYLITTKNYLEIAGFVIKMPV